MSAWETEVEEKDDPQAAVALIRAKLGDVLASTVTGKVTLTNLSMILTAYAMLMALPLSYGMLASTLLSTIFSLTTLTSNKILLEIVNAPAPCSNRFLVAW